MRGMGVDGRWWWWRRVERVSHRSIAPVTLGGGRCDGGEGKTRPGGERVSVKSFNPFRRVRAHAPEFFARVYNIYICICGSFAGTVHACFARGDGIFYLSRSVQNVFLRLFFSL